MSVEGIQISLNEVSTIAASLRTINNSLTTRLEEIKQEMNNLATSWESDASNTIRNNFNALHPRFEEYREVVERYAQFLDNTVTNYSTTETAINQNASAFK